ncbi:(2Fe-2S)-binding protein [Sphaerotilus natans]|jgi:bacterioferritin-associated ferredoxin|uniref:(2Fe-2S)-binding protein n=1 Tax=Sphaerotilus natans TaxID=34103 RepID=UPI00406D4D8D
MIICLCHRVSDRDIRNAVQSGTLSFDLLQDETGVSTGCGRCNGCAREVFDGAVAARGGCSTAALTALIAPAGLSAR